eukprot:gene27084-34242_t
MATGCITSWKDVFGKEWLLCPLDVCLYRAPTDNDKGGDAFSFAKCWRDCGYNDLVHDSASVLVAVSPVSDNGVVITAEWDLIPSPALALQQAGIRIPCKAVYHLHADGVVDVDLSVTPDAYLAVLPRVGLRTAIPNDWDRVTWLGRGPHEAYDDRK